MLCVTKRPISARKTSANGRASERPVASCLPIVGPARRNCYLALLGHIGCTAGNHETAHLFGDEVAMRSPSAHRLSRPSEALRFMAGHIARTYPPTARPAAFVRVLARERGQAGETGDESVGSKSS
jgi:hypothetical protein